MNPKPIPPVEKIKAVPELVIAAQVWGRELSPAEKGRKDLNHLGYFGFQLKGRKSFFESSTAENQNRQITHKQVWETYIYLRTHNTFTS